MENDNLKLVLERCLRIEIKSEKNLKILSNKILEICNNDEKLCKTVVFQIITDLKNKKKLPDVLKELKEKKHKFLETIFSERTRNIPENKQPKTINYAQVNKTTNHQTNSVINTALKKAKLENLKKNFGR